jgi:hypothetical protein
MEKKIILLKISLIMISIPVIILLMIWMPWLFTKLKEIRDFSFIRFPIAFIQILTGILFFNAVYQSKLLLHLIEEKEVFSKNALIILKKIQNYAIIIGISYIVFIIFIYFIQNYNGFISLLLIALAISFSSFIIAVFSALLQSLLENVIEIKNENDLTV